MISNNKRKYIFGKKKQEKNKSLKSIKIRKVKNPVTLAIDKYNEYNRIKVSFSNSIPFLTRITLNFIRHELTNYHKVSLCFIGNKEINRSSFKVAINKKILQKYNYFQEELGYEAKEFLSSPV